MKITMLGTGYVGLVSGTCFSEFGYKVICIDNNKNKINKLKKNIIPIYEPGLSDLVKKNTASKYLTFSHQIKDVKDVNVIFIAVGTPSSRRGDGEADLKYLFDVVKNISKYLNSGEEKLIITKSTVPVGTGNKIKEKIEILRPDLCFNKDYYVSSNPEFLREGSAIEDFMRPDRVVCGVTSIKAQEILKELYRPLNLREAPIIFTELESAEIIKYASNAFLEIKNNLIKSVIEFNEQRKINMVSKIKKLLGSNIKNKKIAFLGVTFKPNTDDLRESPSLVIIPKLIRLGAIVQAHDPAHNAGFLKIKEFKNVKWYKSVFGAIKNANLLVIHTEWNEYRGLDFKKVRNSLDTPAILDLRNIFNKNDIIKLGIKYNGIGFKN